MIVLLGRNLFMVKQTVKRLKISEYIIKGQVTEKVRFAFVSDLHNCPFDKVIEEIKKVSPDALLVGGDFIHDGNNYTLGLDFLTETASFFPVYLCIGNHEKRFSGDILNEINKTKAVCLNNSLTCFKGIYIGGVTSGHGSSMVKGILKSSTPDTDFINRFSNINGFKILLCHHPEYFEPYIESKNIDLTLSGHAHGGQWQIFGKGVLAPGQGLFPKYTWGLHKNRFIISRGIGNPRLIPRINNPAEIVIIDIIPKT